MSFSESALHALTQPPCFLAPRELIFLSTHRENVFAPNLLPEFLRQWPGWLRKDPDNPKKPLGRNAEGKWEPRRWNRPENQARYGEALRPDGRAGIHARDGLGILDFDFVISSATGELLEPLVMETLARLNSYASFSSSGTGLHVFVRTRNAELMRNYKLSAGSRGTGLGEWLGDSFVALTGVAIPEYSDRPVVELSAVQEQFILKNLLNIQSKPEKSVISSDDFDLDFLGVNPKPSNRSYFTSLMRWNRPFGMRDTSHSGWNRYLLRAYFMGDTNPSFPEALALSIRFENYFIATAPAEYVRDHHRKASQWHKQEVFKAAEYARERGRLIFTDGGPGYLATPYEQQATHFLNHLMMDKSLSPSAVRLAGMVVAQAGGRSQVVITNPQMARLLGCNERTVKRLKVELQSHSCLRYDRSQLGTTYKLRLDNPCDS